MKYICLSFDDGRKDTYTCVLPIIQKYGLKAIVNVTTKFVLNIEIQNAEEFNFKSSNLGMSVEDLLEWEKSGNEIACHGSKHFNSIEDILKNIEELRKMNISVNNIGFASPNSILTEDFLYKSGIINLYKNGVLSYLRSGIKVRREGVIYIVLSLLEKITHSKVLFWLLQKRAIMQYKKLPLLLKSSPIKSYTTVKQVEYLIEKMEDDDCLIFMFHSILDKENKGYGKDHWYWDIEKFEKFCEYLSKNKKISVLTTKELVLK